MIALLLAASVTALLVLGAAHVRLTQRYVLLRDHYLQHMSRAHPNDHRAIMEEIRQLEDA